MPNLRRFISQYDFPLHLFILWDHHIARRVSCLLSSSVLRFILRMSGCQFGRNLIADGLPIIRMHRRGRLAFGDNCKLNSRLRSNLVGKSHPVILDCRYDGRIVFGDNSGCSFAVLSSRSSIRIGSHVKIGGNVCIFDHDYHSLNPFVRRGAEDINDIKTKPIVIGDDVFIGAGSIILKGVTIGDRAIIGAGSVVVSDVPSDEVWAGNPARKVGDYRERNAQYMTDTARAV